MVQGTVSAVQVGSTAVQPKQENQYVGKIEWENNSVIMDMQSPNLSPSTSNLSPNSLAQAALKASQDKVRKTPPHILKAKKEYYQHNRETILSKQKEYKKRIATGVKRKVITI